MVLVFNVINFYTFSYFFIVFFAILVTYTYNVQLFPFLKVYIHMVIVLADDSFDMYN